MVTIKEIAEQAQLSSATVSRVLKGDERLSVSQATRERVISLAQQLGYTKHLKKQQPEKKGSLGILQWYTENEELADLYYYSIRVSIEQKALELGYQLVRSFNDLHHPLLEEVDAIIAIGKFSPSQIRQLAAIQPRLIFVDSDTLAQGFSCVTTDFSYSVRRVIDHFRQLGHDEIGLLIGQEKTTDGELLPVDPRLIAYQHYMSELGLYQDQHVYVGNFSTQSGYDLMTAAIRELGDALPSAFFMGNDTLAVGALRALQEQQIPVPQRVQLITFNDTAITRQVYPALSSISVYTEEMGRQAVDLLEKLRLSPTSYPPRLVKLSTQLIIRESSL